MTIESNTAAPPFIPTAPPVGFIHLGQWHIGVVNDYADEYSSKTIDYLPLQAVLQCAHQDLDSMPVALPSENERHLYGIREFLTPDMLGITARKTAALYIRLARSQRYLASLCAQRLAADNVDEHRAAQLVKWQTEWDQALAQYQHQTRALAWWQRCGLEEISEPGINERRRQLRQSPPTMIQALERIDELSERGHHSGHNHRHSAHCRCSRSRNHTHGPF